MRRLAWMLCLGVLFGAGTPPRAQVPDPAPRPIGPDEWPTPGDAPARTQASQWTEFEVR